MTIDPCEERAEKFIAGELGPLDRQAFLAHARSCEACAGIVALDEELCGATADDPLTPLEGDGLRSAVMRDLRARRRAPVRLKADTTYRWLPVAAAAVLVLAAGVLAGRMSVSTGGDAGTSLASSIQRAALDSGTLADVENSPYIFSNVAFRPLEGDQVAISFDVGTHVDLTARRSDPLVRQLVVQAVLNPSPIGARLNAISYAEGVPDRAVMKALQVALLNDPSTAVRLRALEALEPYKSDPEIQSALLMVLTTADSVQMRLQAIDYLVESRADPQALRQALQQLDPADEAAALVKAGSYIQ